MSKTGLRSMNSIGIAALLTVTFAPSAHARTIRCGAADVDCLIEAIREANTNGRPNNRILLAAGTYSLTNVDNITDGPNGLPSITSTLTIDMLGPGAATLQRLSGAPAFRLLHVGAGGKLTLRGILVAGGSAGGPTSASQGGGLFNNGGTVTIKDSAFTDNGASFGGGIFNSGGTLTIEDSTLASNGGVSGGAIRNDGALTIERSLITDNLALQGAVVTSGGTVRIRRSVVSQNDAGFGGPSALFVTGGTVLISNSSFVGNRADGGAIQVNGLGTLTVNQSAFVENFSNAGSGAAILNLGTAVVENTTFARNVTWIFPSSGFPRALVLSNLGNLRLVNSTFAESADTIFPENFVLGSSLTATTIVHNTIFGVDAGFISNCGGDGVITTLGHNIFSRLDGCTITLQSSDLVGDAELDALTDDGTPGNAHYPLLGTSPAINAADNDACGKKDQIGQLRRRRCDIGAIEFKQQGAPADEGGDRLTATEETAGSIVLPPD